MFDKHRFLKVLRNHESEIIKRLFDDVEDSAVIKQMLKGNSGSLTKAGYHLLNSLYQCWSATFEKPLSTKQLILLNRHSILPFYIKGKTLHVFDPDIGTFLVLSEGDAAVFENLFGD